MSDDWTTITKKDKKPPSERKTDQEVVHDNYYTDSDTVVFKKKVVHTKQVINATNTNSMNSLGTNHYYNSKLKQLDENTGGGGHKKVSLSVSQLLQKALVAKKWSQKDLVKNVGGRAGVNAQDVQKIARGEAMQNDAKLTAIEKALNMRLRGKNAGEPYFVKSKK